MRLNYTKLDLYFNPFESKNHTPHFYVILKPISIIMVNSPANELTRINTNTHTKLQHSMEDQLLQTLLQNVVTLSILRATIG